MALVDNAFYVDSVGWTAVTAWATGAAITAGALRRQLAAPAVNSERVFVCVVAGTTHATTEPTWTITRGAKTTDNTVTWQECTGIAAINGDATNTPSWTITATPPGGVKNTAVTLGQVIKRDNGASYQICTTAGTAGNGAEPGFSDTAGTTTADGTVTWTSLGVVGNFTGNQAPHARINPAVATNWAQLGNNIFVKSSHAETQTASITILGAGTLVSPIKILCHGGGAYPPTAVTTGATVTCSGGNSVILSGIHYSCGITFNASGAAGTINIGAASGWNSFENCAFKLSASSSTMGMFVGQGTAPAKALFKNCTYFTAHAGQKLFAAGHVIWHSTTGAFLTGGVMPSTMIRSTTTSHLNWEFRGIDFTNLGANVIIDNGVVFTGSVKLVDCKLHASSTISTPIQPGGIVRLVNCDSGATNHEVSEYAYQGTLTTEETIIRTGGASDGVTPISWKIISTANAKFINPFECPAIAIWNEDTGSSMTLTIECRGAAIPNNDEVWVDVEYLGSSGSPLSSFVSDAKASVLATAAAQDSSSETWGGSTASFKLVATFTPELKGFVYARVKVGKASSTFYVDPKITLA